nr:hypothetical protein CFP56_40774 [Quercus suber]
MVFENEVGNCNKEELKFVILAWPALAGGPAPPLGKSFPAKQKSTTPAKVAPDPTPNISTIPKVVEIFEEDTDVPSGFEEQLRKGVNFETLKTEVNDLLKLEEKLWQQWSHTHWMVSGDKNTAYFHNQASQKFRRNNIPELRTLEGRVVSGDEDISALIVEESEIVLHAIWGCEKVQQVWTAEFGWVDRSTAASVSFPELVCMVQSRQHQLPLFATTTWSIWHHQNKSRLQQSSLPLNKIAGYAKEYIRGFKNLQQQQQKVCRKNQTRKWSPPGSGSPTETLLRLLLPLNDKVQWTSRDVAGSEPPTSPRSEHFTGPFNRNSSLKTNNCNDLSPSR